MNGKYRLELRREDEGKWSQQYRIEELKENGSSGGEFAEYTEWAKFLASASKDRMTNNSIDTHKIQRERIQNKWI